MRPPIGAPATSAQSSRSDGITYLSSRYQVLHRFNRRDGALPDASLVDVNGTLFGTTERGGAGGQGAVYSLSLSGKDKVLHSFVGYYSDGAYPSGGLLNVSGTLYGTTPAGGASRCPGSRISHPGCGTIFSVSPSGSEKVLHSFTGGSDGAIPEAGLIDVNGTLYGTSSEGGSSGCNGAGCGTVFSLTTSGSVKVLYAFAGGSDGTSPRSTLTDVNGTLYGTTYNGGGTGCDGEGCGTVYSVTTSGTEKVLHAFSSGSDGSAPVGTLIYVKGTLYGTTWAGGQYGSGTLYSVTTRGVEKALHSFGGGSGGGSQPDAGVIAIKGILYGTTFDGGPGTLNNGTVYDITTMGSEQVLHSFAGAPDGAGPEASLTDVKGKLYGTTAGGGSGCGSVGCGTVFRLIP